MFSIFYTLPWRPLSVQRKLPISRDSLNTAPPSGKKRKNAGSWGRMTWSYQYPYVPTISFWSSWQIVRHPTFIYRKWQGANLVPSMRCFRLPVSECHARLISSFLVPLAITRWKREGYWVTSFYSEPIIWKVLCFPGSGSGIFRAWYRPICTDCH